MNLFTKNNTIGYNTIVDDAEDKEAGDKEAGEYHHEEDTTTISTKNRRRTMFLVIGGSVSALVVLVLFFCAIPASPSLPSSASSASSLSSLRTAALAECRPNGHTCPGGYPFPPNCCGTARCVVDRTGRPARHFKYRGVCKDPPPTPPPTPAPTPPPTPPPTTPVYDPTQDFCFTDNENPGKYCWYPDNFPVGNWKGVNGRGVNDCGSKCTKVYMFDPNRDFCFTDNDNDGKYCWFPTLRLPSGNWKEVTGAAYNTCGPKCYYF